MKNTIILLMKLGGMGILLSRVNPQWLRNLLLANQSFQVGVLGSLGMLKRSIKRKLST
jgi:hypothetical protein